VPKKYKKFKCLKMCQKQTKDKIRVLFTDIQTSYCPFVVFSEVCLS